ncbi:hypothetical protein HDU97_004839 [Phlyctochytrium planicorne]|nr:hypothetical protein HDU97_004839 [Phlyctochytrium planicorne]
MDVERRLKDSEAENAELKAQLAKMVSRFAAMEDQHALKQSQMNQLHVAELETLTLQHTEETEILRGERDDYIKEIAFLQHEINALKDRLEGVSATAAYVTDIASVLEDEKEANESELELFRAKAITERQALETQLAETLRREANLERKYREAEEELAQCRTDLLSKATLIDGLKSENEDLRTRLTASRLRNFSLSSLMDGTEGGGNVDDTQLQDVNFM